MTEANLDDWKGEHLIRTPRRGLTAHESALEASKSPQAPYGVCQAEECSAALSALNRTGYCRDHRHKGRRYVKGQGYHFGR